MKLKRKIYEALYPIYFGIKELIVDILSFIEELKKPRTWSAILYGTFFVAAWYKNFTLMKWTLPLILIIYFIRQKKERRYIKDMYRRDLKNGIDSDIVKGHYERYVKQCGFSHKERMPFGEWKQKELRGIDEKHKSDQSVQRQKSDSF